MNTAVPARPIRRLWAAALTLLMVISGLALGVAPANAAAGDVTSATLDWGIKQSFRSYISGFIAHGGWTTTGNITGEFSWSAGTGTAQPAAGTGAVAYTGSIHFTGHEGFGGIGAGAYALDLTVSNVRIVQDSAASATIVVDTVSNSIAAPTTFVTSTDVEFASVDLSAANVSTEDTVAFAAAPASLTAAGAVAFAGFYAAGDPLDPVSFSWPVEKAPAPAVPTVVVSKTTDLSPAGELVTVTGTGFLPSAPATTATRPPLAGKFGGAYVVFGKFADDWKPSAGASSSARKIGTQLWVVNPEDAAGLGSQAVAVRADGSFSLQLKVSRGFGEPDTGNYGIYTYSGGGAAYAGFETYTPVTFSTTPAIAVSKTSGLNPLGETLTVKGWNFTPQVPATTGTRPPLAGKFGGAYIVFGKFPENWKPSAGAPSGNRKNGGQVWGVSPDDLATVGTGGTAIAADGSFTVELTVKRNYSGEPETGNYGIYTYSGSGAAYAAFETYTPLSFTPAASTSVLLTATGAGEGESSTLVATVSPQVDGTVTFRDGDSVLGTAPSTAATITTGALTAGQHAFSAQFVPAAPLLYSGSTGTATIDVATKQVAAGSLAWGIKESFRSYVAGPIAHGSITTSGVSLSGGAFVFGQAAGSTFDGSTGSTSYSGSVRFRGHDGLLDVSLSNPVVTVESSTRATLSVSVNGGASTSFATLDLSAGVRSTPGNTVTFSGVPASLTAAGARVFSFNGSNFYAAGTALDPVTFSIGTAAFLTGGSSTVAAYRGETQPPATPPATTGIVVAPEILAGLVAGGEVTFTADGFEPSETGIMVVIYSDPIVLARDVVADASGRVTWTGRLPAELTGTHTLTVQGSVNRGVVLDIAANVTTAAMSCPVDDATLSWGFKESFRSYISGSIANGEWTVADGASYETPDFSWSDGEGSYEDGGVVAFRGSITFTGHGGILNTTVANPQLKFIDADTAVLLLDVSGTTQDGAEVNSPAVEFVELDLSAATVEETDGVITVTGAPAVLTAEGSAAFGTYESGEEFDPVSFTVEPGAACESAAAPSGEPTVAADPTSAETANLWWILWLALALAVIAAVAVILVRRRSHTA